MTFNAEEINAASPSRQAARCPVCGIIHPMKFGVMPIHDNAEGKPCQGIMRKGLPIQEAA